jgi:transposase-like protein
MAKRKLKIQCESCGLFKREHWIIRFKGKYLCSMCRRNMQFFRDKY